MTAPLARKAGWPGRWSPQHLRIGVRLRLAFACIMLLMFFGSGVALWNFREIQKHVEEVSRVEARMTSVLQLDNSIIRLINRLHRAADTRRPEYFEAEASRLLAALPSDGAWVAGALRSTSPQTSRQAVILESLNGILEAMPARVNSLIMLARAGDWLAVHARLLNQIDTTDDVVSALVRQIDADLSAARKRLLNDVQRSQRRAAQSLAAAGFLSLLTAAFLGLMVTRSITRPLASLDAGARALARGHFTRQLDITGSDELANLAMVFNQATRELEDLYCNAPRCSPSKFSR